MRASPAPAKIAPLMEMAPHQLIEGIVIAGRAVGSHRGYIYIRGEYRYVLDIVDAAIEEAYARGYLGKNILGSGFDFDLSPTPARAPTSAAKSRRLMESLEGKRGYPRIPPALPCRRRPVRLAHRHQQRRDPVGRSFHLASGRGMVR